MPARRSRAIDRVKEKTTRALLPEMVTGVVIRVIREGLPVPQHSPSRDPAPPRDHSAPLARDTIPRSAGKQPEHAITVADGT